MLKLKVKQYEIPINNFVIYAGQNMRTAMSSLENVQSMLPDIMSLVGVEDAVQVFYDNVLLYTIENAKINQVQFVDYPHGPELVMQIFDISEE